MHQPPGAVRRAFGPAAIFVTGAILALVALVIPTSAGAMSVGPGTMVSVNNTPYSSTVGGCDESRDGWHIIMNGVESTGSGLTGSDFGPITLNFSNGSTGSAVFTDASSKTAHFIDSTTNQSGGPFTINSATMTFPAGTTVTEFNNFVISHPPCGSVTSSTTSTTADTSTSTSESTTTTTDSSTTTSESTTTTEDTTTTTNPVTTETTSTTLDTTTTTEDTTTTTSESTTTTEDTTTTTNPVTTETTSTTLDTTTTTEDTTTTTSPVSTETTSTTTPVSTVPTTTPSTVEVVTPVFVERQVETALATPYATTTTELPRTGGPDGGPFIVAGLGLMAAGGGLWLLQRRRASA